MKTISNNNNGKVIQTESVNFIFDCFESVNELLARLNVTELNIDKANTNSFYLSFDMNGRSFELRISNHTKRLQNHESFEIINVQVINGWETYTMNIFNQDSLVIVNNSLLAL